MIRCARRLLWLVPFAAVSALAATSAAQPTATAQEAHGEHQARPGTPSWRAFRINVPAASAPGVREMFTVTRRCKFGETLVNGVFSITTDALTQGGARGPVSTLQVVAHEPLSRRTWRLRVLRPPAPVSMELSILCISRAPFAVRYEQRRRVARGATAAGDRVSRLRTACPPGIGFRSVGLGYRFPPDADLRTLAVQQSGSHPLGKPRPVRANWQLEVANPLSTNAAVSLTVICVGPKNDDARRLGRQLSLVRRSAALLAASPVVGNFGGPRRRIFNLSCPSRQTLLGVGYKLPRGVHLEAIAPTSAQRARVALANTTPGIPLPPATTDIVCIDSPALSRGTIRPAPRGPSPR